MQAFSAADIISPAIKRTKWFLFEPFRWSTFLKLCLVSVLTEGGSSGNFNFPSGGHPSTSAPTTGPTLPSITAPYFGFSPMQIALIAAIIVVSIGLVFIIAYLITRLRFAMFHCLVTGTREIRPGWRIYDAQSWRFFLLSIAVGVVFFIAVLLLAIPFILGFYRMSRSLHPDFGAIIGLVLPLIPIVILLVLAGIAIHVILHDLMLPHIALENASAGDAWRQARARIAAEKGGFLLYAFLRIILPLAAMIGAMIVLAIPVVLAVILVAVPIAGLTTLMAGATGVSKVLFILLISIVVLIGVAIVILLGLCATGPIGIAVRNYALLFYGGRYKVLGDLLFPPQPPPLIETPSGSA